MSRCRSVTRLLNSDTHLWTRTYGHAPMDTHLWTGLDRHDMPARDYPPFDVDAEAMRQELRGHGVETPDDRLFMLVNIADKYIAEGDPDLDAWDPRIMRDVRAMWPEATKAQRIGGVRRAGHRAQQRVGTPAGRGRPRRLRPGAGRAARHGGTHPMSRTGPMDCMRCGVEVEFLIDECFMPTGGSLAGMQPKLSVVKVPRLTCPACG
jgi:hypothetical protein